jgi:iron-sulfur cluster assembly protein
VLLISESAAEAIKRIVSSSPIAGEGGVRIVAAPIDEQSARLDLSVAESPAVGDTVIEEQGAHVFLDDNAASFLDDKVLDATIEGETVSFAIIERQSDWSQNGQPENFDPRKIL